MNRMPYRIRIVHEVESPTLGRCTVQWQEAEGQTLREALAKALAIWRDAEEAARNAEEERP